MTRGGLKHERPDCVLTGWAAAWAKLDRIDDETQRTMLAELTRHGGVQGAPALKHLAGLLCWLTGLSDYPTAPKGMDGPLCAFVEARARDLLAGVDADLFPRMRT